MVQNNKILTVSYGTFSCTLEGFDDAFGTMKAIAEYFRDLAAEDRYFGAEPPQPDTDMLAHIAQQEIARRVEAHRDETGIVLRAQDAAPAVASPVASAADASVSDAITEASISEAPVVEQDATPAVESQDAETISEAEPISEDVEPSDIQSVPEQADVEDAPAEDVEHSEDHVADDAPITEQINAVALEEPGDDLPTEDTTSDVPADDDEDVAPVTEAEDAISAFFGEMKQADIAGLADETAIAEDASLDVDADDSVPEAKGSVEDQQPVADVPLEEDSSADPAPETEAPAPDSIAAKLQRIRAVVSRGIAQPTEQEFSEDEHADTLNDEPQTDASDVQSAQDDPSASDVSESHVDTADEIEDRLDALDPADDEEISTADMDVSQVLHENEIVGEAAPALEPEAPVQPAQRARVVKVTRQQFDAILAADRKEAEAESSLSDEDEADLMRELAEVEAEFSGEDELLQNSAPLDEIDDIENTSELTELDEDIAQDDDIESIFEEHDTLEDHDIEEDLSAERAILSENVDVDPDVSRLLDEADVKLEDDETNDRRSEFAHLRAAMAAGKAEEAAGGSMSDAKSDRDYREDLARVVRPRRPDSTEQRERSRRPQDEKPAPLKLVAAQRVDAEAAPVQPRRVMSTPIEDLSDEGADGKMKFADYAENVGAVDLPDLLEAAAAYLSFVEGQEQFSRPQLMTKVRMVEQEEFSREDGLRSFGLLLRDGKIEKTQAGRFTVSDRIGFRPEDMRAVG